MKKISLIVMIAVVVFGCADKKELKRAVLDSVENIHEKVMGADEQLLNNKMLLDSMVKFNSTADIKDSVYRYVNEANHADSIMMEWMHRFDPDQTGKSDNEKIQYFSVEKKRIMVIDSLLNSAVSKSDKYLIKMKMK